MIRMAGTINTKHLNLVGMEIHLIKDAKFILDGKTVTVSKDWKIKSFDFDDGILKVKNLDDSTSDYRVEADFSYPQEAETHWISGAHINPDVEQ